MADVRAEFRRLEETLRQNPGKVAGVSGIIQFNFGNDSVYHVTAEGGAVTFSEGAASNPNVTFQMTPEVFAELLAGKVNPTVAFMTGRLKIQGDLGLALRLQSIFS